MKTKTERPKLLRQRNFLVTAVYYCLEKITFDFPRRFERETFMEWSARSKFANFRLVKSRLTFKGPPEADFVKSDI